MNSKRDTWNKIITPALDNCKMELGNITILTFLEPAASTTKPKLELAPVRSKEYNLKDQILP